MMLTRTPYRDPHHDRRRLSSSRPTLAAETLTATSLPCGVFTDALEQTIAERQGSTSLDVPGTYLHHRSELGRVQPVSDSIGHSYRYIKATAPIIEQVPVNDLDSFFMSSCNYRRLHRLPGEEGGRKATINGARGMHAKIHDRFDPTLIASDGTMQAKTSPLSGVPRAMQTFSSGGSFEGYADFFCCGSHHEQWFGKVIHCPSMASSRSPCPPTSPPISRIASR